MEYESRATQCDDEIYGKMKLYFDIFSENNAFLGEDEAEDTHRAMLLKHVSLIEEFEREKEEMKAKFNREKESLKRAYENEIKDYQAEIEKLTKIMNCKMNDIEAKCKEQYSTRETLQRGIFERERQTLKQSVQEQMDLMARVEEELRRILTRLIQELKRYEPSACKKLENDLCDNTIKESCVTWLKDIFAENGIPKIKLEKAGTLFTSRSTSEGKNRVKGKQDAGEDELYQVGEVFRQQKKELTEIFMKEKKHLEEEIKNNCLEYKKKLDREYEERIKSEVNVWQETIKEYEREIDILRYERERMDRNYCVEIDRLKLETEKEKVEIRSKYMKERELLRKSLSDTVMNKMIRETGLNHVANQISK